MSSVLKIENLWKQYRLGTIGHGTLRQDLQSWWARIWGKEDPNLPINLPTNSGRTARDRIWALKDVSIDVKQGEVLGIIGSNGAGKSTLLRIISRITAPTRGCIKIKGRVASLLEVGTGFHQELTGRENIFLNGAILGMTVGEIRRKFDEIVDFSGVEKFIDTPVKRYSSGMFVRLAFAVAAHLDSEIMIVDEVLAVGDTAFQKKCLGKMGDVARTGRTVLFVSHNIAAVQKLCSIACLLDRGQLVLGGSTDEVVAVYYELISDEEKPVVLPALTPESYLGKVSFIDWSIGNSLAQYSSFTGEPLTFQFTVAAGRIIAKANFGIALYANDGTLVWAMRNLDHDGQSLFLQKGIYRVQFNVPYFPLRPGAYQILVSAVDSREGTLAEWRPKEKLNILPKNESGLPVVWQGILNITGKFDLMLLKNISDLE